jgi:hypothetical protein
VIKRQSAGLIWFTIVYVLAFVVLFVINLFQAHHAGGHAYF